MDVRTASRPNNFESVRVNKFSEGVWYQNIEGAELITLADIWCYLYQFGAGGTWYVCEYHTGCALSQSRDSKEHAIEKAEARLTDERAAIKKGIWKLPWLNYEPYWLD